jgi:hypothetical protein
MSHPGFDDVSVKPGRPHNCQFLAPTWWQAASAKDGDDVLQSSVAGGVGVGGVIGVAEESGSSLWLVSRPIGMVSVAVVGAGRN